MKKEVKQISVFKELRILLTESLYILFAQTRNLIISLLFPIGAAGITVWIAGKNMFVNMENTKSALFILVCAAIWGGLFNSIQIIVKERKAIKRSYVSGTFRIGCYITSRALVQMFLCLIQSGLLCLTFLGISYFYGNTIPKNGIIFDRIIVEYYTSIFLIMFASDTLGLLISSIVKSEQLASQLSPYILIAQLLFSGVLFSLKGYAKVVASFMISRWGMEALGSISDLNNLPLRLHKEFPDIPHKVDDAFLYTEIHLQKTWIILIIFILIQLVIGSIMLRRVVKDKR